VYIHIHFTIRKAVPWLRRLAAGLSQRKTGFDPRPVHVRFVVNKVTLKEDFLPVLLFAPVSIILPMLHTQLHVKYLFIIRTSGRNLGTVKHNNILSNIWSTR
jgi:hypothetical protein